MTATLPRTSPAPSVRAAAAAPATSLDAWIVALGCVLGVAIRALYAFGSTFPLNDGGLFYQMIMDLKAAHFRLPVVSSYNAAGIPFAYPPLAFYVTGWLSNVTGIGVMDWLRYLPFALSSLTIVAFYAFARSLLSSRSAIAASVIAFALMPRSFAWMLMGGGLTRSFGFLFVLLALYFVHRFYTERWMPFAVGATLCSALTVLSHLGTAPFLGFSTLLLLLVFGRHVRGVLGTVTIGTGVVALTAPWWASVVVTHGWGPFLAASSTGGSMISDLDKFRAVAGLLAHLGIGSWGWSSTGESLFPILAVLALFGALSTIVRGAWFLPIWWLAILVLDTRQGITFAAIPVALLAGIGMRRVLLPLLDGGRRATAVMAFLVLYAAGAALLSNYSQASDIRFLNSLMPDERRAMRWVADQTPRNSRFLIVPGNQWDGWEVDKTSEWFPVLAQRASVATVQGTEWLPHAEFTRRNKQAKALRACGAAVASCLDDWSRDTGILFDHVYIPQPPLPPADAYRLCCKLLLASLRSDPRYTVLYDAPGAVIFRRNEPDRQ